MLDNKLHYEVVPEEHIVKFFWRPKLFNPKVGYGIKIKYLGILENGTLETTIVKWMDQAQNHLAKFLNNYCNSPLEVFTPEELLQIKQTIQNSLK